MFAFALCEKLRIPHPDRMSDDPWRLTSRQLAEWGAYYEVREEPEKYRVQSVDEQRAVVDKMREHFKRAKRRKPDNRNNGEH